jgi:hypothetical protein
MPKIMLNSVIALVCTILVNHSLFAIEVVCDDQKDGDNRGEIKFSRPLIVNPVERLFQSDGTDWETERNFIEEQHQGLLKKLALDSDKSEVGGLESVERQRPYLHYVVPILITLAAGTSTYLLFSIRSN